MPTCVTRADQYQPQLAPQLRNFTEQQHDLHTLLQLQELQDQKDGATKALANVELRRADASLVSATNAFAEFDAYEQNLREVIQGVA